MSGKAFVSSAPSARKEASRNGATNTDPALDMTNLNGGPTMPADGNITARGDSASVEKSQTWKSIGQLARELADNAGATVK